MTLPASDPSAPAVIVISHDSQPPVPPVPPAARKRNPPLTDDFKVQVITTFYAPAVMGVSFAASLIEVAKTDAAVVETPEWRAAAREAMETIRQGCAAMRALPAPGTQTAYTTALKSADKLERFLAHLSRTVEMRDAKKLVMAAKTLRQGQEQLIKVGQSILVPRKRMTRSRKVLTNILPGTDKDGR
jgi:hypothetical protein